MVSKGPDYPDHQLSRTDDRVGEFAAQIEWQELCSDVLAVTDDDAVEFDPCVHLTAWIQAWHSDAKDWFHPAATE